MSIRRTILGFTAVISILCFMSGCGKTVNPGDVSNAPIVTTPSGLQYQVLKEGRVRQLRRARMSRFITPAG
jgi:hypothetical protein